MFFFLFRTKSVNLEPSSLTTIITAYNNPQRSKPLNDEAGVPFKKAKPALDLHTWTLKDTDNQETVFSSQSKFFSFRNCQTDFFTNCPPKFKRGCIPVYQTTPIENPSPKNIVEKTFAYLIHKTFKSISEEYGNKTKLIQEFIGHFPNMLEGGLSNEHIMESTLLRISNERLFKCSKIMAGFYRIDDSFITSSLCGEVILKYKLDLDYKNVTFLDSFPSEDIDNFPYEYSYLNII